MIIVQKVVPSNVFVTFIVKYENMLITTYSDFRQQLKFYLDKVRNNHTPLVVKTANAEDVVVLSKADYESME